MGTRSLGIEKWRPWSDSQREFCVYIVLCVKPCPALWEIMRFNGKTSPLLYSVLYILKVSVWNCHLPSIEWTFFVSGCTLPGERNTELQVLWLCTSWIDGEPIFYSIFFCITSKQEAWAYIFIFCYTGLLLQLLVAGLKSRCPNL